MANKIVDETLKFTIVINGNEAQKEYGQLERATKKIAAANKELEAEAKKLEKANKQNTAAYQLLTAKIDFNNETLAKNDARMKELTKDIGINNLSMRQLAKEAGRLGGIMRNLDPNSAEWQKYNVQLQSVRARQANLRTEMQATESTMGKLKTSLKQLVFPVSGALLFVDAIKAGARFVKEFVADAVKLSIEAKGVEFAFKRLGDEGEDAFIRVKAATRGLLSDLDIKKSLVELDNFNISLEESATLFEFLSIRATQTKEPIDQLKQSLVEGLSKESKLRIDNLGISTAALNAELEKTPNFVQAVANIAKTEIAKAGNILDEAASSSQRFAATMENAKLRIGNLITGSGVISFFQNLGSSILEAITPTVRLSDAVRDEQLQLNILAQKVTAVNISNEQRVKALNELNSKYPGFLGNLDKEKVSNEDITKKLKEVNQAYIAKIVLMDLSQEVEEKARESADKSKDAFNKEEKARQLLNKTLGVTQTNRLLENNTLKEAADIALKNTGVTEESIKAERSGINILDRKQKALLEVQGLLSSSNVLEGKATEKRAEANEAQDKLNRFTEKYADLLKEVEGITGTDAPTTTPDAETPEAKAAREATEKAARDKAIKDLETFEKQKLDITNNLALQAEEDEFKRRELKIQQDAIQQQKELEQLSISAAKKKELSDLIKQQEAADLQEVEDARLARIAEFDARKKELEDQIKIDRATTEEEAEAIRLTQQLEKDLAELEYIEGFETQKGELKAAIIEKYNNDLAKLNERAAQRAIKEQLEFTKKEIEFEKQKANAKIDIAQQLSGVILSVLGNSLGAQIAAIALNAIIEIAKLKIATASAVQINMANAVASAPPPFNLPAIIAAGIQNAALGAQSKLQQNKIIASSVISALGATISSQKSSSGKEVSARGFQDGLYPVSRQQDGKEFQSGFGGQPTTQIVKQPKLFLAGEMPELIVDPATFKKMDPMVINYILELAGKRVPAFQNGLYPQPTTVQTPLAPTQEQSKNDEVMNNLANAINRLVDEGVDARALIGDDEIKKQNQRQEKLINSRTLAKINT